VYMLPILFVLGWHRKKPLFRLTRYWFRILMFYLVVAGISSLIVGSWLSC